MALSTWNRGLVPVPLSKKWQKRKQNWHNYKKQFVILQERKDI